MDDKHDPVAELMDSLRTPPGWTAHPDTMTEEKLMSSFEAHRHRNRPTRRAWMTGAALLLVLGGVGFAAAGGLDLVRRLLVEVRVETPDGVLTTTAEVETDENGVANLTIPTPDGGEAQVQIEPDASQPGATQMTVTLGSQAGEPAATDGEEVVLQTVTISATADEADEPDQP